MRFFRASYGLVAINIWVTLVGADQCSVGAIEIDGNWFCQPVKAIQYSNVGTPGSYNEVVGMSNGACSSQQKQFSGPLAPLDEEVRVAGNVMLQSAHFAD